MTLAALAAAGASSSASNDVEPGVLGFLIVAAMGVALVFLLRSMNKQFRKITPEEPPEAKSSGEDAKTPAQTPILTGVSLAAQLLIGRGKHRAQVLATDLERGRVE